MNIRAVPDTAQPAAQASPAPTGAGNPQAGCTPDPLRNLGNVSLGDLNSMIGQMFHTRENIAKCGGQVVVPPSVDLLTDPVVCERNRPQIENFLKECVGPNAFVSKDQKTGIALRRALYLNAFNSELDLLKRLSPSIPLYETAWSKFIAKWKRLAADPNGPIWQFDEQELGPTQGDFLAKIAALPQVKQDSAKEVQNNESAMGVQPSAVFEVLQAELSLLRLDSDAAKEDAIKQAKESWEKEKSEFQQKRAEAHCGQPAPRAPQAPAAIKRIPVPPGYRNVGTAARDANSTMEKRAKSICDVHMYDQPPDLKKLGDSILVQQRDRIYEGVPALHENPELRKKADAFIQQNLSIKTGALTNAVATTFPFVHLTKEDVAQTMKDATPSGSAAPQVSIPPEALAEQILAANMLGTLDDWAKKPENWPAVRDMGRTLVNTDMDLGDRMEQLLEHSKDMAAVHELSGEQIMLTAMNSLDPVNQPFLRQILAAHYCDEWNKAEDQQGKWLTPEQVVNAAGMVAMIVPMLPEAGAGAAAAGTAEVTETVASRLFPTLAKNVAKKFSIRALGMPLMGFSMAGNFVMGGTQTIAHVASVNRGYLLGQKTATEQDGAHEMARGFVTGQLSNVGFLVVFMGAGVVENGLKGIISANKEALHAAWNGDQVASLAAQRQTLFKALRGVACAHTGLNLALSVPSIIDVAQGKESGSGLIMPGIFIAQGVEHGKSCALGITDPDFSSSTAVVPYKPGTKLATRSDLDLNAPLISEMQRVFFAYFKAQAPIQGSGKINVDAQNPFEILGLGRNATREDVIGARNRAARLFHHDTNPGASEAERSALTEKFQITQDVAKLLLMFIK